MTDPNNPYGQQSGEQPQQPGQPYGQPQQPGFDPNQPQFGGAPDGASPFSNQPAQPSGFAKFIKSVGGRVVGVLLIVIIAVAVWFFNKSDAATSAVGDCLKVTGSASKVETESVSCDSMDAAYKVVEKGEGITCGEYESEYTESGSGATSDKLCLDLNAKVGDCFKISTTGLDTDTKVDCSETGENVFKVAVFDATTADESTCSAEQIPFANEKRNTVICFEPNA